MSGPPPPAWFAQQQQQQQQQQQHAQSRHYASSYGTHLPPPPPPARQALDDVPPPLFGYSPAAAAFSQSFSQGSSDDVTRPSTGANNSTRTMYKCEACQVSLDSRAALVAHTSAHVTCTKCAFTASRKVVNAHYATTHGKFASGGGGGGGFKTITIAVPGCPVQRFRICVGSHPDDVRKWIQDRKKRFPRVKQQQQQQQSRTGSADATTTKGNKKEPSALGSLLDGYGSSSSEDDDKVQTPVSSIRNRCNDGADDMKEASSTNDESQQAPASRTEEADSSLRPPNYRTRPCRYFMRNGSCRNGDACHFRHDDGNHNPLQQRQHQQRREHFTNAPPPTRCSPSRRNPRQSSRCSTKSLLRKLLENDRRRESALSLQLLQYLVDCNYLQKQKQTGDM